MVALTLDEERILSSNLIASEARGPMRRAGLEELVAAGDKEARRRRILCLVVALLLSMA